MREMEELLRRDRAAGVPEPPDVRYTVAAVRQRLGSGVPDKHQPGRKGEWLPVAAALCLLTGAVAAFLWSGASPWWLGLIPVSALTMVPILLRKGA